jgi:protein-disulfide isomerase
LKIRIAVPAVALILLLTASAAFAQAAAPAAAPDAPAPVAATAPVDPLPPANPRFFTAATPSVDTVNSFLNQVWGFDSNRLWRVEGIQPTPAPGVVKVTVFITTKDPKAQIQSATFYVTPDGKHAIGEGAGVVPFGATPFAPTRDLLKERANGASRGTAGKDLELVEFADLQCPHCKEAQAVMDDIAKTFPKAHVVFQLFPLVDIHPSAFKAAAYGVCVQKQSNDAFFKYAAGVFETQEGLAPATEDTLLKAAVKRAGLDSDAIAACAATQATKDIVNGDIKLAEDAGVDQTPLLSVNGRLIPIAGVSFEAIKQIIQFQATLDHVDSGATAEALAPKPVQPQLTDLPKQ